MGLMNRIALLHKVQEQRKFQVLYVYIEVQSEECPQMMINQGLLR